MGADPLCDETNSAGRPVIGIHLRKIAAWGRGGTVGLSLCGLWLLGTGMPGFAAADLPRLDRDSLLDSWRWVRYGPESGLFSQPVNRMCEDNGGTMWAASASQVAWYDGCGWQTVDVPGRGQIDSVDPFEQDILLTRRGQLYRGGRDGFTALVPVADGDTLAVFKALQWAPEAMVLQTDKGLFVWRDGQLTKLSLPGKKDALLPIDTLKRTDLGHIHLRSDQGAHIWRDGRWVRLDQEVYTNVVFENRLGGFFLVARDPDYSGIWTWDPGGRPVRTNGGLVQVVEAIDMAASGDIVAVYSDETVRVRRGGRWGQLASTPDGLLLAHYLSFGRNGDLWSVTPQGLYLHRGAVRRWEAGFGAARQRVNELLRTRKGDLWSASSEGVFVQPATGAAWAVTQIDSTPLKVVTGLAEDAEGGVWVSSGGTFSGAYRWYGGEWRHYGAAAGLDAPRIHRIETDARGHLWFLGLAKLFGRPGPGAFEYDGRGFRRWGTAEGLLHGAVYAFTEAADGARYFGTMAGISRWRDGQWTHWTREDGLSAQRVFSLAVDTGGRLWFTHNLQRAYLGYIDTADRVRYVDPDLVSGQVWEVVAAASGAVWAGTKDGLYRIKDGVFAHFGLLTGLRYPALWPVLPLDDRVLVGTHERGVRVLHLTERDHPPPRLDIAPPVVEQRDLTLRWTALAYRGELPVDQVTTRIRRADGSWSAWGTVREARWLNLQPGDHDFEIEAKGLFGQVNRRRATVHIPAPFYEHPLFRGAGLAGLALVVGLVWTYRRRRRAMQARLEVSERRYRALVENPHFVSVLMNLDGAFLYASPQLKVLSGYETELFFADRELAGRLIHPEDRDAAAAAFQQAAAGQRMEGMEFRYVTADGRCRWSRQTLTPVLAAGGRGVEAIQATFEDITDRKQNEDERQRLIEELESRNAELERFTYTVSHDLKSPLITIKGFLGLLEEDVRDRDQERMRSDMDHIASAVDRMRVLLDELLELSRIGRQVNAPEAVDMAQLAREAAELVAGRLQAAGAEVSVAPDLPPAYGDRARLLEVWQNLMDNAAKFMGDQACPKVEIAWRAGEDGPVYWVGDNGVGIDPEYHEKVFGLFERLSSQTEGTGIGLALVRRIVEVHGGRIWVESEGKGEGARFCFTVKTSEEAVQ